MKRKFTPSPKGLRNVLDSQGQHQGEKEKKQRKSHALKSAVKCLLQRHLSALSGKTNQGLVPLRLTYIEQAGLNQLSLTPTVTLNTLTSAGSSPAPKRQLKEVSQLFWSLLCNTKHDFTFIRTM